MSNTYRPSRPSISPVVLAEVNERIKLAHAMKQFKRLSVFDGLNNKGQVVPMRLFNSLSSYLPQNQREIVKNFSKNMRTAGNSRNENEANKALKKALKAAPRVQQILNSRQNFDVVVMPNGTMMLAFATTRRG